MKTLYALLGVEPGADSIDLENAFLRLKAKYPQSKLDSDDNARIQFQGIQQAYKTLINPDTRSLYDRRLASAGIKTVTAPVYGDDESPGWISTRNLVIAGLVALLISGMWVYHSREKAQMEKEIADHALQLVEEEKKHNAEMQEAEEARRQASFDASQRDQEAARDRQARMQTAQDSQSVVQQLNNQTAAAQRQKQFDDQQADIQKQRAAQDAARRLAADKQQLSSICYQRYNRPDC